MSCPECEHWRLYSGSVIELEDRVMALEGALAAVRHHMAAFRKLWSQHKRSAAMGETYLADKAAMEGLEESTKRGGK